MLLLLLCNMLTLLPSRESFDSLCPFVQCLEPSQAHLGTTEFIPLFGCSDSGNVLYQQEHQLRDGNQGQGPILPLIAMSSAEISKVLICITKLLLLLPHIVLGKTPKRKRGFLWSAIPYMKGGKGNQPLFAFQCWPFSTE